MTTWPYAGWTRAGLDAWTLGCEASTVIGLRMMKLAMGGAPADTEARLMLSEKVDSVFELQAALLTGRLGTTPLSGAQGTLRHYRRKVRANRRRLS